MTQGEAPRARDWSRGQELRAGDIFLGLYQPSPETVDYWRGVEASELRLRFCPLCRRHHHPRRIVCPDCNATGLDWRVAQGVGRIYSFSEIHRTSGIFSGAAPYLVGIVELAEGVHLFGRIVRSDGVEPAIDAPVTVAFRVLEQGYLLPVFVLQRAPPGHE